MIWAIKNNNKIKATPNKVAICPCCKSKVRAKCGDIKIWHWAHINSGDCDVWYEPESEWHINWKNKFLKEQQEVVIGKHRADIKTKKGLVIELQNSSISIKDIKEREKFYKKMIWIVNGETFAKNLTLTNLNIIINQNKRTGYNYIWRWMPKFFIFTNKQVFIDLGDKILYVKKWDMVPKPKTFQLIDIPLKAFINKIK